jgi:hypothetical protein
LKNQLAHNDDRVTVSMSSDDFREIALSMQGAVEGAHMNHPDFRANGRIFASLHADDVWGTVMLTPEEQQELLALKEKMFKPSAGAWGRQGCTDVRLDAADARTLRQAMTLAWERIVAKPPVKRRPRRST